MFPAGTVAQFAPGVMQGYGPALGQPQQQQSTFHQPGVLGGGLPMNADPLSMGYPGQWHTEREHDPVFRMGFSLNDLFSGGVPAASAPVGGAGQIPGGILGGGAL